MLKVVSLALLLLSSTILIAQSNTFPSSGSVGVGTISPDGLQIQAPLNSETSKNVHNIRIGVLGDTPRIILDYNGYQTFEIDNSFGKFRVYTPGKERFVITSDGNVGINVITGLPDEKLTVNGKIKCEELKVVVDVADYVFEDTYNLMTLDQVEKYVKENKHLPGVPGKKEIEIDGYAVGQMTNKLLEKVEELTLYIIQLQKQVTEQQIEISSLKAKK